MSDEIYDGVDGEDVANLYEELYTLATDYANAKSTEQAKFKKKYPKKYGTIRRLLVNEIHSSNKAEGGIVGLYNGGGFESDEEDDVQDYSDVDTSQSLSMDFTGDDSDSGSDDNIISGSRDDVDALKARDKANQETYEEARKYYQETLDNSPQVGSRLRSKIEKAINEGRFGDIELESGFGPSNKTMVTGVYNPVGQLPGLFGLAQQLLGGTGGKVYSGYGEGSRIPDSGDSGEEPSKMIKKIVEKKKEEDTPLTEAELDYYGRGLGEASKPMKSLSDINQFISGLYSDTVSPTGAKLSENKRYLTLPNGKVIDLKTGRQLQSIEGLELFMGGRI